jgi:ParB-like chromosome segregation protein Spo0J
VERIARRLRADQVLRDPVIVGSVPDVDGYVLLDGTNRKRALASLNLPFIMVQVLDYADPHTVQLRTWCHAARIPLAELLEGARTIDDVETSPLSPLEASDALRESSTLAVLLNQHERCLLSRAPGHPRSRAAQLRDLVDLYESEMRRQDCDPESVEEQAHALCGASSDARTLIAFPPFSRSQVVTMATQGALIPAGITRHIIQGGRALRVNLPLDVLAAGKQLHAAQEQLQRHLSALQPRVYQEPTILYDS